MLQRKIYQSVLEDAVHRLEPRTGKHIDQVDNHSHRMKEAHPKSLLVLSRVADHNRNSETEQ